MLKLFDTNEKLKEQIQELKQLLFLEESKNEDLCSKIKKFILNTILIK